MLYWEELTLWRLIMYHTSLFKKFLLASNSRVLQNIIRLLNLGLNFHFQQIVCQVTELKDRKDEQTRGISPPLDIINQQPNVAKIKAINFKLKIAIFQEIKIKP